MSTPKELQIVQAIKARLIAIQTAAGYHTDAGNLVYQGRRYFSDDDTFPAISILEDELEVVEQNGVAVHLNLSLAIQGIVHCDPNNPSDAIQLILADIRRAAIRPDDPTLGRLVRKIEYAGRQITHRAEGNDIGIGVVQLIVDYSERLDA